MFTNDPGDYLGLCDARSFESSIWLYLVLFGCNSLVFGADWLGDHQNGASAYVLHLSGSSSHLRVSSLIAVFLQIAPYVCSSPLCNNQISLHRTKQAGSLCDPRPWHHVCAHYSSPLCNNQTNTTKSTVCTMCVCAHLQIYWWYQRRGMCACRHASWSERKKCPEKSQVVKGIWRDFILIRLI